MAPDRMRRSILPLTIVAMAALLGIKSVTLVRAAAPLGARAIPAQHTPVRPSAGQRVSKTACIGVPTALGPEPRSRPSAATQKVLLDLREKSAALNARAAALDTRERLLSAAAKRLTRKIAELRALDAKLNAVAAGRKDERNANWNALVELYESMRPREAAAIFDGLAMPVLLEVVHRMNERKAAAILAAMRPAKARALTVALSALPVAPKGAGS